MNLRWFGFRQSAQQDKTENTSWTQGHQGFMTYVCSEGCSARTRNTLGVSSSVLVQQVNTTRVRYLTEDNSDNDVSRGLGYQAEMRGYGLVRSDDGKSISSLSFEHEPALTSLCDATECAINRFIVTFAWVLP